MICLVAGTRPNFMKIAPIRRALDARRLPVRMIHTGQHYDAAMSDVFFRDLGLPPPDLQLRAGGGTHAEQTASVLVGVEADLTANRPAALVVVGDVTSTLAAALAAAKLGVPVVHVEAGLRSRDWQMPEEINRVLTDQLSDLLLIPSRDAEPNLLAEGIAPGRIVFVGNVMIDSLKYALARQTDVLKRFGLHPGQYAVITLHRPSNVDTSEALRATLRAVEAVGARIPVIFPAHPRTIARIADLGLSAQLNAVPGLRVIEPVGYNDFVVLLGNARLVATDSGGIQEETTALRIPCLTLRDGTERPVTVIEGTNTVTGLDPERIAHEVAQILEGRGKVGSVPEGWDGQAAERIANAIERFLAGFPAPKRLSPHHGSS